MGSEVIIFPAPLLNHGVDIRGSKSLLFILRIILKGGETNAGVLREMPGQEGDEGSQKHNHEKWQAGNSGNMPHMWD